MVDRLAGPSPQQVPRIGAALMAQDDVTVPVGERNRQGAEQRDRRLGADSRMDAELSQHRPEISGGGVLFHFHGMTPSGGGQVEDLVSEALLFGRGSIGRDRKSVV